MEASQDPVDVEILKSISAEMNSTKKRSPQRKLLASIIHKNLKRGRKIRSAARAFNCSRKLLSKARRHVAGRKATSRSTVKIIHNFYEDNSTPLPDKKYVSKKTHKPRHILKCTIGQLYQRFKIERPSHKVLSGIFFANRAAHVKTKAQAKYNGCLCEYCENI